MTDLNPFTKNAEYLKELMYEKQMLSNINHGNGLFLVHTARLLEHEIARLHSEVFRTQFPGETDVSLQLPEPEGEVVSIQDKVYIPKEPKNYNYVGRILGPRGMTAKDLEVLTGTKIQIRGRGSLRDPEKEEINRSIFGWEHLNDELHVLIECEDTPNRAKLRVENAKKLVTDLLKIPEDGVDDLKRKQLLGLAVINGNLRTCPQRPFSTSQLRQCRVFTPVASTASYSDNSFSTQAPFSPTYQPLLYSPYNPPVQRQAFSTPHSPYPAYFSPTHSSRSVFTPSPPAYLHTQQSLKSPDSAISSVERLDRSFHQRLNISGQEYPTTPRSTRSYKIGNSDGSVYSNWRHREPKPKHLKHVQQDPEAALNPVLKDLLGPARPDSPPLPSLLDHFNESAGKGSSAKN